MWCCLCTPEFIIVAITTAIIWFFNSKFKNTTPIFNVYQRPNKHFYIKAFFMYSFLRLRQCVGKLKKCCTSKANTEKLYESLEKPQILDKNKKAVDAVYFNGADPNGNHFIIGMARRNQALIDAFIFVKLGDTIFETPKLPGTSIYQIKEEQKYKAEGFEIKCLKAMKKWQITYEGKMKTRENNDKLFDVKINLEYSSDLPYFNFESDMDPWLMAKCIANEKWSRKFFDTLKANHQTHYEQHGDLKGTILVDGKTHNIEMNAMRDHSFGKYREWRNIHKYVFHLFAAENGDRFTVGNFCLSTTMSNFSMGYVCLKEDKKIYPVTESDFILYQHGEKGTPPTDYAFTIKAGGKNYTIQVNIKHTPHFYISKDWECKVVEGMASFEINGHKGWGCAEWEFRNPLEKKVSDYKKAN